MSTPRTISPVGVAQNIDLLAVRDQALLNRLQLGSGQLGSQTPSGVLSRAGQGFRGQPFRGGRSASKPWKLTGFIESGAAKIRVAPGLVNNLIPKIGGTSLVALPAPSLTVTGASGVIYIKATFDVTGTITDLVIENASVVPEDTDTLTHKLVGSWISSGGVFTSVSSILDANQTLVFCYGTPIWSA